MMGKYFRIRTFRTTVTKAVTVENFPSKLTTFGRFLLKTNLDKLPLFWNVLKGDMTLVGPRGSTVDEVVSYSTAEWKALKVKPGLTGEWKVNHETPEMSGSFT
jgi:lipopolysaccharide/colanic/teichoic acid biosynthesis glycosyltransferase